MALADQQFTLEDHLYVTAPQPPALRSFRPRAEGPFPVVVNLRGGAWRKGDSNECRPLDEAIACAGIASAALDCRHAGDGYPSSPAPLCAFLTEQLS